MDGQMDIEMDGTAGCSTNGLPQHALSCLKTENISVQFLNSSFKFFLLNLSSSLCFSAPPQSDLVAIECLRAPLHL